MGEVSVRKGNSLDIQDGVGARAGDMTGVWDHPGQVPLSAAECRDWVNTETGPSTWQSGPRGTSGTKKTATSPSSLRRTRRYSLKMMKRMNMMKRMKRMKGGSKSTGVKDQNYYTRDWLEPHYSIKDLKEAFEQAEIDNFKYVEGAPRSTLSQRICRLIEGNRHLESNPLIVQGAINALKSEGFERFITFDFLMVVVVTFNGVTKDDFQELSLEWASENLSPFEEGNPDPDNFSEPGDWEIWYQNNAMGPHEVYGEVDAGGALIWFDREDFW